MSSFFWGGYYGTQYRVRLGPPFAENTSYKAHNLTGFNHQKTLLTWISALIKGYGLLMVYAGICWAYEGILGLLRIRMKLTFEFSRVLLRYFRAILLLLRVWGLGSRVWGSAL